MDAEPELVSRTNDEGTKKRILKLNNSKCDFFLLVLLKIERFENVQVFLIRFYEARVCEVC